MQKMVLGSLLSFILLLLAGFVGSPAFAQTYSYNYSSGSRNMMRVTRVVKVMHPQMMHKTRRITYNTTYMAYNMSYGAMPRRMMMNRRNRGYASAWQTNSNVAMLPQTLESWQIPSGGVYRNGGMPYNYSSNGQVLVTWGGMTGGTCNVRYTEAGMPFFNYRTSGACDQGSLKIGSLQPGQVYKFQVAQDSWDNWSGMALARAS